MFIWSGLGFLVAVIGFGALILTEKVSESITGNDRFYQQHGWVVLIGMLVAAALTYGLHRLLLLQKGRVVIDKATGEEIVLTSKHSLFAIPVELWPIVFVALGLVFAIFEPRTSAEPSAASVNADQKLKRASECGMRGDFSSAVRLATEVIDRQPSHVMAYVVRGTAYRRSGEYAQAIADFDRTIELDSRNSCAYTQRAFARQQSQDHYSSQQILADLNLAIELDANNPLAHILRGNEYAAANDHDVAITDYDQALRLNPRSYNAIANRAASKLSLGRLDEARRDLQQALELNPPAEDRRQIEEFFQVVKSRGE